MKEYKLKEKETSDSLNCRIDAHKKFADKDITDWILQLVNPMANESILDVGCGNGNQALKYALSGAVVVGVDISKEFIEEANNKEFKDGLNDAYFSTWDMNETPTFGYGSFNKISSCFSLYYANDMKKTISNLKLLLKTDGKLFVFAPTGNNATNFMHTHCNKSTPSRVIRGIPQ